MGWRDLVSNLQGTATRTFPEPVLYTPEGSLEIAIDGIFREPFVGIDVDAELEVGSTQPTLDVQLADLPAPPSNEPGGKGDRIVVVRTGVRYRVVDSQDDGEGMTKLFLHEQPTK